MKLFYLKEAQLFPSRQNLRDFDVPLGSERLHGFRSRSSSRFAPGHFASMIAGSIAFRISKDRFPLA